MKLSPEQRRALAMLAGGPRGFTEALFAAHGFTRVLLQSLVEAGLVEIMPGTNIVARRAVKVARVHITEAGRQALWVA